LLKEFWEERRCENGLRFHVLSSSNRGRFFLRKGAAMMSRNLLLMQSIQGHLELLARKHPKKAASPVARKAKRYVQSCLRQAHRPIAA